MNPIIQPGRNAWRTAHADASGILVDAADYYHAFYDAARQAKRYIVMSGWQFFDRAYQRGAARTAMGLMASPR